MRKIREFKRIRTILIIVAIIIAFISLFVSQSLVKDLSREEHSKMEVFAKAYQAINAADENTDLGLVLAVISGNKTIPVIITDENESVVSWLNIEIGKRDTTAFLNDYAHRMRANGNSIRIMFDGEDSERYYEVCYDESLMLNRLTVYPYIQLAVVFLFVLIAIFALLSFKKTEQNRVWVGLSKETAHQLGTPISSLMAWTELLKDKYDDDLIVEMEKDVNRLQMVAERFSKIGSMPEPVQADMVGVLDGVIDYVEHRSPATVKFVRDFPNPPVNAKVNMRGKDKLTIKLKEDKNWVTIDVTDTGKGIAKNSWRSVFDPGYTTKERGWGLGLSLAKRIVTEYHKGKIYVAHSEIGKGTTFRIELPR